MTDFRAFTCISPLKRTTRNFRAGDPIIPLGTLKVKVEFQNKKQELELFVLPDKSAPIVGRNWLQALDIV